MAVTGAEFSRAAVHQVHGAKLATDITSSLLSSVLLWQGRTGPGLLVRYLAPAAGSAVVLARGDLARLAATRRGGTRSVTCHPLCRPYG